MTRLCGIFFLAFIILVLVAALAFCCLLLCAVTATVFLLYGRRGLCLKSLAESEQNASELAGSSWTILMILGYSGFSGWL